jgi:DNA-binding response OmpR family regulator
VTDILIIEDNPSIADGIRQNLEVEGYVVRVAGSGAGGLRSALDRPPTLVILDLTLPDIDGFQVLRSLRDGGFEKPVLILSARVGEADKLRGFRVGADDYVTKPFSLRELLARVDALCRRRDRQSDRRQDRMVTSFGEVEVDFVAHRVTRGGREVPLRPREFELLKTLMEHPGRVLTRLELLRDVMGFSSGAVSRALDTHIAELRRKLEPDASKPRHIVTVWAVGYRFEP